MDSAIGKTPNKIANKLLFSLNAKNNTGLYLQGVELFNWDMSEEAYNDPHNFLKFIAPTNFDYVEYFKYLRYTKVDITKVKVEFNCDKEDFKMTYNLKSIYGATYTDVIQFKKSIAQFIENVLVQNVDFQISYGASLKINLQPNEEVTIKFFS